jgi:succinoglycan biosynthesis transport protein ExoP
LIGLVPKFDSSNGDKIQPQIVKNPRSFYSESIQNLCASLMLSRSGEPPKTILVTSATPKEGKSTLSLNLAVSFALQGRSVLLVETDMRRPVLAKRMGIEGEGGLSLLLSSESKDVPPVEFPGVHRLLLLPGGPVPPYPGELLGSQRMKNLMRGWRERYDVVMLDGSPVLPVVDALILCEIADATIQVVRHDSTSRNSLKRAHELLETHTDRSIGVVINAIRPQSSAYYGYYGYKQSEYYGSDKSHEKT